MEILILLAIGIAAVLIINTLSGKISELHFRFEALNQELRRLHQDLEKLRGASEKISSQPEPESLKAPRMDESFKGSEVTPPEKPVPQPLKPAIPPSVFKTPEPEIQPEPITAFSPVAENPGTEPGGLAAETSVASAGFQPEAFVAGEEKENEGSFWQKFVHNNPDLEKFIGENLINKIGIAILVLGIGYFVKFAIDQDWINEIGRVFIGILAGGLLIGVAHRLRNSFSAFSSVLVGGGLAVLYFTIAIAFHEYHLFSQTAAFLIMVVITGFSILLSVAYDRVELAVLAILGGFATPFMVSTGEGNYQVLFTYILILNAGMLVLAYLKNWKLLNYISYGFTVLLFGGWLSSKVLHKSQGPYIGALVFASLFYLTFFLMNIVGNLKKRGKFVAADIGILLSNTFLYYSAGMAILQHIQLGLYQGLFTVAVGVFNFLFAYLLYRNQRVDRNLIYLLVGLVITFISLAVPVQLEGNYITLFWALEAVLLLWLAQKSGLKIVALSSIIITGLMLISLIMDWQNIYVQHEAGTILPILLNKGFVTGVVALFSLQATRWVILNQEGPLTFYRYELNFALYRRVLGFAFTAVLYLVLVLELNFQLNTYITSAPSRQIILGTYNLAFIGGLKAFATWKQLRSLVYWSLGLGIFALILQAAVYNPAVLELLKAHFLGGEPGFSGFPFHYLNVILTAAIMVLIYRHKPDIEAFWPAGYTLWLWFFALIAVYLASSELLFHVLWLKLPAPEISALGASGYSEKTMELYYRLVQQTNKVGFPILWGLCAFAFMFIGLGRKNKHLRIISLSLFGITLLKLFLYDIRGISEGGKIAAFISLGVLLLVISFMYQRLKKLILADEQNETSGADQAEA